jgi:hypothetical protein
LVQSQRTSRPSRVPSEVLFARGVKRIGADGDRSTVTSGSRALAISVASQLRGVALKLRGVASAYSPSLADLSETPRNVLPRTFRNLRRTALASKSARMAERFAGSSKSTASTAFRVASGKISSVTRLSHVWRSVGRS